MRPVIQIVTSELEEAHLFALNYFDQNGQHADQIIDRVIDELSIIDAVYGTMGVHDISNVDMFTDSEQVFKEFMALPGVNVTIVPSAELAALYRVLSPESDIFPMVQEKYLPKQAEKKSKLKTWLYWLRKLFQKGTIN